MKCCLHSCQEKLKLIEETSIATNQQNEVSEADRRANDKVQIELQELIYRDFGFYYERERGDFDIYRGFKTSNIN